MLKHGHSYEGRRTRTYKAWAQMKTRCLNKNFRCYSGYGGRGITICERWLDFENFLEDMKECPIGLTLERIDNDEGYQPGNCKWATQGEQNHNQRLRKDSTSGTKGVSFHKRTGKWQAYLNVGWRRRYLGLFDTAAEAAAARKFAEGELL